MTNEFDDDIAGIFDDVTPDMFFDETSAVDEIEGKFVGTTAFNASVDERLRGVRATFANSFGQLNPIAVLSSETTQRVFIPQQDENLGMFLERLKREARAMGAHWFFFAKKNVFAVYYEEEGSGPRPDVASDESREQAEAHGSEHEIGIIWYAERREGTEIHHRHGALRIENGKITKATEGDGDQTIGVFSSVLDVVRR